MVVFWLQAWFTGEARREGRALGMVSSSGSVRSPSPCPGRRRGGVGGGWVGGLGGGQGQGSCGPWEREGGESCRSGVELRQEEIEGGRQFFGRDGEGNQDRQQQHAASHEHITASFTNPDRVRSHQPTRRFEHSGQERRERVGKTDGIRAR